MNLHVTTLLALVFAVVSCGTPPQTGSPIATDFTPVFYYSPLSAVTSTGMVEIHKGGWPMSTVQPAFPMIERTRFMYEQNRLVVKSRGPEGIAAVEIFNSNNGEQLAKVAATEITPKGPVWALGMED